MSAPLTQSEIDFLLYLEVHGYTADHEARDWKRRLGIDSIKNPDFLVSRAGEDLAICEVKEFTDSPLDRRMKVQRTFTTGAEDVFGTLADAVRSAAWEQLAPFAASGLPLVAVIGNPYGVVAPTDPVGVAASLLGLDERSALVARSETGATQYMHPYLSAVLVVHQRAHASDFRQRLLRRIRAGRPLTTAEERQAVMAEMLDALDVAEDQGEVPAGEYEWVEVFDLAGHPSFTGIRLPQHCFDGPRDRHFVWTSSDEFVESTC